MKLLVPMPYDLRSIEHGRNLRIVHLLQQLSKDDEITIVVADAPSAEPVRDALPGVNVELAQPGGASSDDALSSLSAPIRRALAFFGDDAPLRQAMALRLSAADVVLGFGLPSLGTLIAAKHGVPGLPVVCDLIDDPWLTWQSVRRSERWSTTGFKAALCIQLLRRFALRHMDALVAVAPRDAGTLERATGVPTAVVPNGVDASEIDPSSIEREATVAFTGAMDFPPNEAAACYFARRVWPLVLERCSDTQPPTFAIIGANPTPQVQALASIPGVRVTGRVDDVKHELQRARVAVAPMVSGSGLKNKILEACAAGTPVVANPLGVGGLPTGDAHGIKVTHTGSEMAEQVFELLTQPARAQQLGHAGWQMIRRDFTWTHAADTFRRLLKAVSAPATTGAMLSLTQATIRREALLNAAS